MENQKFRITNWNAYNKALVNRGSITFWLDEEAFRPGMNQQRSTREDDLSAMRTLPSPLSWWLNVYFG
ncbi:hypothetical protein ERHA54_21430 [Erwinia rhapontici]|uniref:DDE family transposase n=1 Tax=Erwinia rhapontici TaxID=55212 RepID=A0ABM7MZL6_ERWRD|nr:hypothetical protein ERHA53_20070 [Erwinia rhapontici]BCQ39540.1 hypothetical protein ERHA54_21430 [Erwinia rhapontici]BCQ44705.1 hypothetical protein ERHA55_22320 [Erwinia rhapontici]